LKLIEVIKNLKKESQKIYKKTFLVNYKNQLIPLPVVDIAYFYLEHQLIYCVTHSNKIYSIQLTLEKIQEQLDPVVFFRANRQTIVARKAITTVQMIENRKLKIILKPATEPEIIVSKSNASNFKRWLKI
jgi:two-component system LytT family response regulator